MQLGAIIAAAAQESGLDWRILAQPLYDKIKQTKDNIDRIPELQKWIEFAQAPKDSIKRLVRGEIRTHIKR